MHLAKEYATQAFQEHEGTLDHKEALHFSDSEESTEVVHHLGQRPSLMQD